VKADAIFLQFSLQREGEERQDKGRLQNKFEEGKLTSLMLEVSVSIMVRRSIPIPQPAVGGSPYSKLVQNPSSMNMASSSPCALAYIVNRPVSNCRTALACGYRKTHTGTDEANDRQTSKQTDRHTDAWSHPCIVA